MILLVIGVILILLFIFACLKISSRISKSEEDGNNWNMENK